MTHRGRRAYNSGYAGASQNGRPSSLQPIAEVLMKMVRIPLALALLSLALLAISGPGVRLGWWPFPIGFQILRWAAYAGLAAAAGAIVALAVPTWRARGVRGLLFSIVLGAAVAYFPWQMLEQAKTLPPIHDISTDLSDPPAFVAVLPLRADATNSAVYGGPAVAAAQRSAYPDIQPLLLPEPAAQATARALTAAQRMGWQIVATDQPAGRIEATATTRWFGFKDDVVIRITPTGGSRIDVRSVSRVGTGDVGANANRIRSYLAAVRAQ
jgi:uncharacterized protein (DUF1499 family)